MSDDPKKLDPNWVMGVFNDHFTRTEDGLTMPYDEWAEQYKPGSLLEGWEDGAREKVAACDRRCLWSFCGDGDDGEIIANGVLVVNFIGHYITEVPYEECVQMVIEYPSDYGEDDDDEPDAPPAPFEKE